MKKTVSILLGLFLSGCALLPSGASEATPVFRPSDTHRSAATPAPSAETPAVTTSPNASPTEGPRPTATPAPPTLTSTLFPSHQPGQAVALADLHMMTSAAGWGVESTGLLLRTVDGGQTWRDVTPPGSGMFAFLDPTHAWATLGVAEACTEAQDWYSYSQCMPASPAVVWRTDDGGETWQASPPYDTGDTTYKPVALQFVDQATGWFLLIYQFGPMGANSVKLLRTVDGGASWTLASRDWSGFCPSRGMALLSAQEGWASSDCRFVPVTGYTPQEFIDGESFSLIHTEDGGLSWEHVNLPPPQVIPPEIAGAGDRRIFCGITRMAHIAGLAFSLEASCSVGQYDGLQFTLAYLTPDGGQSWRSWRSSGNELFVNAATGWRLYTEPDTQLRRLQRSTDGGLTWSTLSTVAWETARFDFVSEQIGWAIVTGAGASALVHTLDGGRTWSEIKPVVAARGPR